MTATNTSADDLALTNLNSHGASDKIPDSPHNRGKFTVKDDLILAVLWYIISRNKIRNSLEVIPSKIRFGFVNSLSRSTSNSLSYYHLFEIIHLPYYSLKE